MKNKVIDKVQNLVQKQEKNAQKAGAIAAAAALSPAIVVAAAGEEAVKASGVIASKAKAATEVISEKAKEEKFIYQMKKYNPLFPEQYAATDFKLPNMIMIVDSEIRKNIEVCNGAIGWKSIENEIDVLHLYDTAVLKSGLTFVPAPICNSVYYVNPHDHTNYINIDILYEKMQQEKLAELANVAFCLGAKQFHIEIWEEEKMMERKAQKAEINAKVKVVDAGINESSDSCSEKRTKRVYSSSSEFTEKRTPIMPELLWFKDDTNFTGLIRQVYEGKNTMKSNEIVFNGSQYSVVARASAAKIDGAVKKLGATASANINEKSEKEYSSKIIFQMEF